MGTRPSAVATLVERSSRYTAIVALPDGIKAEQSHGPPAAVGNDTCPSALRLQHLPDLDRHDLDRGAAGGLELGFPVFGAALVVVADGGMVSAVAVGPGQP